MGEYASAIANAERARRIFTDVGDALRLARLSINVANIHHRQNHFSEALAAYERAYEQLIPLRDNEGVAVALHNMAVCRIALNDFPGYASLANPAARMGIVIIWAYVIWISRRSIWI